MTFPATHRATELLFFIEAFIASHQGVSPTFDEMRAHLGLKSKSGIRRLLSQLEERGHIQRLFNRDRAIELVAGIPVSLSRSISIPTDLYLALHTHASRSNRTVEAVATDAIRCWLDAD